MEHFKGLGTRLNRQAALAQRGEFGCRSNVTTEDRQALHRMTEVSGWMRFTAATTSPLVWKPQSRRSDQTCNRPACPHEWQSVV